MGAPRWKGRTTFWLLGAVLLLVAGSLLMVISEGGRPVALRPEIAFPSRMRPAEYQRMERRAVLPPLPPPRSAPGAPALPPGEPGRKRDPLLWALPPGGDQAAVVLEANALRHSRLGELFLGCLGESERRDLDELRNLGIDPLKDVDRVALTSGGMAVSGFFDRVRWDEVFQGARREDCGREGVLYLGGAGAPGEESFAAAVWRNQLLVLGPDRRAVEAAIDRVEGRAPAHPPPIAEPDSYGELYGVVPGKALRAIVPPHSGDLADRLAAIASRIELHADAMDDVAVTARVQGEDPAALEDLARAMGAALAVARVQAAASGDRTAAELLEHARVERGRQGFSLELALPAEALERWFAGCRKRAAAPAEGGTAEEQP